MSKRLLALNLLLAVAAVVFATELVRVLSAQPPLPSSAAQPSGEVRVPPKEEPAVARPSIATYSVVATRSLFSPERSEIAAQPASLPLAAKPVLHGVVINGVTRLAYLEDPTTKRIFGYKIGDNVAGGRLEQIEGDRVVIKRPEGIIEVRLKDPSKPRPVGRAPATPRPPAPGVPPAPSVAPPGPEASPPGSPFPPRAFPPFRRAPGEPGAPAPSR